MSANWNNKARHQGKLIIEAPPFHPGNRVSQSEFVCLSCVNTDHADHNAAKVIAMQGARQLLAGKGVPKKKKWCWITRIKIEAEGSRTGCEESQSTLGKTVVSRLDPGNPRYRTFWALAVGDFIRVFSRLILAAALLAVYGEAQADFQEGLEAYNSGNYLYAFDEFRALALNGDAAAQYRLGVMYAKGQGVPKDDKQAASWYIKAAEQDDTRAQFNIAEMYAKGQGVPLDDKQSAFWYLKAADHGLPKAQYIVGLMYAKGQGVLQDFIQAYKWLSLAGDMAVSSKGWIEERMTPEQIKKAQVLAQEWLAKYK